MVPKHIWIAYDFLFISACVFQLRGDHKLRRIGERHGLQCFGDLIRDALIDSEQELLTTEPLS